MATKVIVNVEGNLSAEKADALKVRFAKEFGVLQSDVIVAVGMSVSVVEVPDAKPFTHKSTLAKDSVTGEWVKVTPPKE